MARAYDYRDLALEHGACDLVDVAATAALYRQLSKLAIETIVERDRKIESLQRQLEAVKEEYRAHARITANRPYWDNRQSRAHLHHEGPHRPQARSAVQPSHAVHPDQSHLWPAARGRRVSAHESEINRDEDTPGTRTVHLTRASTIVMRPVRWLWTNLLALGAFALLGGREGIGKSICAYTVAAYITRGTLPGACFGTPRAVIVAATEDSWEHTIVPRLMAADADLERVYRVDVVTADAVDTALSLPRDMAAVGRAVRDVDAALIILDPLLSRLEGTIDTHKDADVRRALEPLASLADSTLATVLGLIHVNKSASTDPLNTLMASRAFAAVARSVLFVMTDPEDEKIRLLGLAKSNLGRIDVPTRSFRIEPACVAHTAEGDVWTGKLEWLGESTRSIREATEAAAATSGDRSATSEAGDWLQDYLTSQGGRADWADIKREGAKAGHRKDALRRSKNALGITSTTAGFPRRAFWALPTVDATSGESATAATTASNASTGAHWAQRAQRTQSSQTPREGAPTGTDDPPFGISPQAVGAPTESVLMRCAQTSRRISARLLRYSSSSITPRSRRDLSRSNRSSSVAARLGSGGLGRDFSPTETIVAAHAALMSFISATSSKIATFPLSRVRVAYARPSSSAFCLDVGSAGRDRRPSRLSWYALRAASTASCFQNANTRPAVKSPAMTSMNTLHPPSIGLTPSVVRAGFERW
jgi:hypothetical protein